MAAPKKNTVDYFPHFCNPNRYTEIMGSKYGNDGYAFYYQLFEVLGKTPNHGIDCSNKIDMEYLSMRTGTNIEKMEEMIETMIDIRLIDKNLWEESRVIWCEEFVQSVSEVYSKRTTSLPTKNSFRRENPSFRGDNSQSKGKESIVKQSIEELGEEKTSPNSLLDIFGKNYLKIFGVEYYASIKKDGALLKSLEKRYGEDEVIVGIEYFFSTFIKEDWFAGKKVDVGVMSTMWNKIMLRYISKNKDDELMQKWADDHSGQPIWDKM